MKSLHKRLFLVLFATLCCVLPAKAVTITLGSFNYDIIAYTPGTSSTSILDLLDDQPWWGNSAMAALAAGQVNSQLGVFYPIPEFGWGPFFATSNGSGMFWQGDMNQVSSVGFSTSHGAFTYAIVNNSPAPSGVPDGGMTAALLGGALVGFVALRRRFGRA